MCKVIVIANQKGGVGKTTTTSNLGIGLALHGKRVLLIDADAQGSLTASLGFSDPDKLETTLATVLGAVINDEEINWDFGILPHEEGVDLMPGNIELSGLEVSLVNVMSRELVMRAYVERIKERYDYILIDCMPSLGMITINAFACADTILIPVQAAYLPVKGLQQLIKTIGKVKRQINPKLGIEGILLTMVDERTNYARDISFMLQDAYGGYVKIFSNHIPMSVRAAEISAEGVSIYKHDPRGKAASAYKALTEEVLADGE
ncbi:MAG: ParA family protein [Clostridium sp.]|nr:ParA family protein [Clostridium sp.]